MGSEPDMVRPRVRLLEATGRFVGVFLRTAAIVLFKKKLRRHRKPKFPEDVLQRF
jgi:hypothetical protein